jgi:gliding motility-associated-like protein
MNSDCILNWKLVLVLLFVYTTAVGTNDVKNLSSLKSNGLVENKGQLINTDGNLIPSVFFKAEFPSMDLYISNSGLSYVLKKTETLNKHSNQGKSKELGKTVSYRVDAILKGASIKEENIEYLISNDYHFNYFYGHCNQGIYDVKEYRKIRIKEIYPNINWVLYLTEKGFKYDFEIGAGAKLDLMRILYKGAEQIEKTDEGSIRITTPLGSIEEEKPTTYQGKKVIPSEYNIIKNEISFAVYDFESKEPFVIDPKLVWGTLYGGSGDDLFASLVTDNDGNVFAAGQTSSSNFPVQTGLIYYDATANGGRDAIFVKFANSGKLLWATYYGGKADDETRSIGIDANNNLFATGLTNSDNFPIKNAGTYYDSIFKGETDAFILKFKNTGERVWCTYFGGSETAISDGIDGGESLAIDPNGNLFVTGHAHTANFPLKNAGTYFDDKLGGDSDGFILKFDNIGNLLWSTYYGGLSSEESSSIVCDSKGNIFITGYTLPYRFPVLSANTYFDDTPDNSWDAFIAKFDNNGNQLWGTLYGGSGMEIMGSLALDKEDNLFVMGTTESKDFPLYDGGTYFENTLKGKSDMFIMKFDNFGNRLWSTFYGGNSSEYCGLNSYSLATDDCGNVYAGFETFSKNMAAPNPGCDNYFDGTIDPTSGNDCFIAKFTNSGQLLWGSYLGDVNGETGLALAVDKKNQLFACGAFGNYLPSTNLPLVNPGNQAYYSKSAGGNTNAFILKFVPVPVKAEIITDPSNACCQSSATVQVTCTAGPVDYIWSNGQTSSAIDSICSGTYAVIVSTYECRKDTISLRTKIPVQNCKLNIPNVFTPNNDGQNDIFWIKDLSEFPNSSLEVYDRWGNVVYQNSNYQNDWDGSNGKNGKPLISGVYYYIFHRSDDDMTTGFINIIR